MNIRQLVIVFPDGPLLVGKRRRSVCNRKGTEVTHLSLRSGINFFGYDLSLPDGEWGDVAYQYAIGDRFFAYLSSHSSGKV